MAYACILYPAMPAWQVICHGIPDSRPLEEGDIVGGTQVMQLWKPTDRMGSTINPSQSNHMQDHPMTDVSGSVSPLSRVVPLPDGLCGL